MSVIFEVPRVRAPQAPTPTELRLANRRTKLAQVRKLRLKLRQYGLTVQQYILLLEQQNYLDPVTGNSLVANAVVDHDHSVKDKPQSVRGILNNSTNTRLRQSKCLLTGKNIVSWCGPKHQEERARLYIQQYINRKKLTPRFENWIRDSDSSALSAYNELKGCY